MKTAILVALMASAAASSQVFANGMTQAQLTRAEVRVQLDEAYKTGKVARLNKVSYPDESLASIDSVRAQQRAAVRKARLLDKSVASNATVFVPAD